jgi:hypothetical protein
MPGIGNENGLYHKMLLVASDVQDVLFQNLAGRDVCRGMAFVC